jgi:UDP-N-acetylenolpyruvoylglucosamine reductase
VRQISADSNGWKEFRAQSAAGLRMNAGAMGAQTFENVTRIRYLDAEGNSHVKNRNELEVFYRRFPLLEKNFAVSANVLRATSRARRNRCTFARIAGETAHDASRSPRARAAFSKILPPFQPAN